LQVIETPDSVTLGGRLVANEGDGTKLEAAGVQISMDGRGRWLDNVFVERLWRSLKHEEVHLKAYANDLEARIGIGQWLRFYNDSRPHQALGYKTPAAAWAAQGCPVDLPLRLDDADASPTTPQGHQPQNVGQI
jgi:putative transposase